MGATAARRALFVLAAACLVAVGLPASTAVADSATVEAVADVGFTVDDLDKSVSFFTGVLDFEKSSEVELAGATVEAATGVFGARIRVARLQLGSETIELTDYLTPRGEPYPYDTRANDVWFQHIAIVVSDMDAAYARLRAAGVELASTGPQRLPDSLPAAAGIRAFYFRDPDGHFLELIEFPNNVEHAHLRITTLESPEGPGIELLEYLAPRDGRTPARPIRANDLAFWRIRLQVRAIAAAATGYGDAALRGAGTVGLRDPDGHSIELHERPGRAGS
jgi:catechol 2,3-dioxygenase-like lactoylglutathione lyase family enzyme